MRGSIWDFTDSECDMEDFEMIRGLIKINRFPGSFCICKKDELVTNYKWLKRRSSNRQIAYLIPIFSLKFFFLDEFNFLPESYALPSERNDLVSAMKQDPGSLWIVKPSNTSCGKGISLINRSSKSFLSYQSS